MSIVDRLQLRTGEENTDILDDCIESAKQAILSRRYPYGDYPVDSEGKTYVESRYEDLQFRIAMDIYNKIGGEGEMSHSENGISRVYESSWVSEQLLSEITPYCGTAR